MKLMGTIDETFARVQAEGIGVSKHFIRQSVLNGTLHCVKAGRKYLINWNTFMAFLENPPQQEPAGSVFNTTGIRPVDF